MKRHDTDAAFKLIGTDSFCHKVGPEDIYGVFGNTDRTMLIINEEHGGWFWGEVLE